MAWLIRAAGPTDAPAIAAIWNPVIRETLVTFTSTDKSAADIALMIQQKSEADHAFLLAVADERVLGFAAYGQFRGGIGYARTMEHTIILGPEGRGRGIGRALMEAIEAHARRRGAHSLLAGSAPQTRPAAPFTPPSATPRWRFCPRSASRPAAGSTWC